MDKQKELNAYEQMAVFCARWFSCGTCPYNPEANKESICPNFDKKLVYAMGKGYRKIPENAVVLTMEEHQKYLAFKIIEPQVRGCLDREKKLEKQVRELDKELNLAKSVLSYDDERPLEKWAEHLRKETAEKFAGLVEFHSVSTRDYDGREIFTISALGLKEILHEEFGIPYDEICKEITVE